MNSLLRLTRDRPPLERPLLLHALGSPMGSGGMTTLEYLAEQWRATSLAEVDVDAVFDFTVRRPIQVIEDGVPQLEWPGIRLMHARPDGAARDMLLLVGAEPHFRWQQLAHEVAGLLESVGCCEAVSVRALRGAVPHTRPAPVQLVDGSPSLAATFGLGRQASDYQGVLDFSAVLGTTLRQRGVDAATLLGFGAFYLAMDPAPHVALEVVRRIDAAVGTSTPVDAIEAQRAAVDQQALDALARSEEFRGLVAELEIHFDRLAATQKLLTTFAPGMETQAVAAVEAMLGSRVDAPRPPHG